MKRYRINEFSRRSGIPADTLRYYEKLGLITSVREGDNGYRTYDDSDMIIASQLRIMRGVDIPLSLLNPDAAPHSLDTFERHLITQSESLTAQIDALQAKLYRMQELSSHLKECRKYLNVCREIDYPETFNLDLPDKVTDDRLASMIAQWQSRQPFVHLYCTLDEEVLRNANSSPMQARLGLGVLPSYAKLFDLPVSPPVIRLAASRDIRCILKVRDPLHPLMEEFYPLTQYLKQTGSTTYGRWHYRLRFLDKQADGSQICYVAIRVNLRPL